MDRSPQAIIRPKSMRESPVQPPRAFLRGSIPGRLLPETSPRRNAARTFCGRFGAQNRPRGAHAASFGPIHPGAPLLEKRRERGGEAHHERSAEPPERRLIDVEIVRSFSDVVIVFADRHPSPLPFTETAA